VDMTVANSVLLRPEAEPVKWIFATVKSTIDTDNSSNAVLLFPFLWNSPYVYTLVGKHTNKWRNIYTFQIPLVNSMCHLQISNWCREIFKYNTVISWIEVSKNVFPFSLQLTCFRWIHYRDRVLDSFNNCWV
jgi:hypothetical protein